MDAAPGLLSPSSSPLHQTMFTNVQSRPGAPRRAHHPKRLLETDEPPAKCARLSEVPPDGGLLPSPGSPLPPALHSADPQHTGPTCIGSYLLLPTGDRDNVARALHLHSGQELQCKVSPSWRSNGGTPGLAWGVYGTPRLEEGPQSVGSS